MGKGFLSRWMRENFENGTKPVDVNDEPALIGLLWGRSSAGKHDHLQVTDVFPERYILVEIVGTYTLAFAGEALFIRAGFLRMRVCRMMIEMPICCAIVSVINGSFIAGSGGMGAFSFSAGSDLCLPLGNPGIVRFGTYGGAMIDMGGRGSCRGRGGCNFFDH
ncbi:hypothetical protein FHX15_006182 [Rhizobium sp. BK650]|uniref:hypothetical protein n=1 Tax=Rhizobium sp. BK650 TaxID=2586990 RepID=UPI00160E63B8|nr:hypothetical protein [Rhizobium sp. BK650]MBB3660910.1 hypothetical protein [Rhizobium sp. BK650]